MTETTATAAEARANFAKIANHVQRSGKTVTILKNSKPWVTIAPITEQSPIVEMNWDDAIKIEPKYSYAVLPKDWDSKEDEGLYETWLQSALCESRKDFEEGRLLSTREDLLTEVAARRIETRATALNPSKMLISGYSSDCG